MTTTTFTKVGIALAAAVAAYLAVGAFLANAAAEPQIQTSVRLSGAPNTVITSANIGANVIAVAQVSTTTGPTIPQGSVDFNYYGNTTCSGSSTGTENIALSNGFATSTVARTVTAGGNSFKVHYSGDANNVAADGQCMPVTATANATSIAMSLSSTTITVGSSVSGTSTLSGATDNAGGSATYKVFTDSACQSPYGGAGNVSVTNHLVPNSPPFQFIVPGTYYWQVVYHGDANNSAATSTCASGVLTVAAAPGKNSPTLSTTLSTSSILTGTSVYDSAVLNGETVNASGTVAYKVYTNNSCSTLFANAGTKAVTNGNVPNSDSVQFNTSGTYYWQAVYSGDGQNNAATSTCTSEVLTVGATSTPPAGAGTISGIVYNDKNKNDVRDAGEVGLAGFSINLYEGANFSGDYDPVFKTATTDANGNYSFTGLANGTYSVEQLIKDGWKQSTDDFASVVISGGVGVGGKDFGNVAKKDSGKNCKEREDRGKHNGWHKKAKHKKDCNDNNGNNGNASSTKTWMFRSIQDLGNGLHLGVFLGKGNKHGNNH
jgi:hypothetical protein